MSSTFVERDLSALRKKRLSRIRESMAERQIEVVLLSLGADLPWCSGYEAMPLERPTVLVIPVGDDATLVVPELEAPRVKEDRSLFALRPWKETEDAVGIVVDLARRASHIAISDRAWASLLLSLQSRLDSALFSRASVVTGPLREVKDEAEVAALLGAGRAADEVSLALITGEIALVGRSEREVSKEITERLIAAGHDRVGFAIVASGPNAASPHHDAGYRTIGRDETVVCDFGGSFRLDGDVGYCSDTTRTVVTGKVSSELRELYDVLELAQKKARDKVAIGVSCEEIDRVARTVISDAGFGEYFIHRVGHGIGIEEHEEPYIVEGNATPLRSGHAFSIEPGIYLPGRMGARIEDIVVLSDNGVVSCNVADHSLHVVDS